MRVHPRSLRARASSLVALLLVVLGSPGLAGWLRPCPHAAARDVHVDPAFADAVWFCGKRAPEREPNAPSPGQPCTCVGPCHVTPVVLPPSAPALEVALARIAAEAPILAAAAPARGPVPHALPFANAPPSLVA